MTKITTTQVIDMAFHMCNGCNFSKMIENIKYAEVDKGNITFRMVDYIMLDDIVSALQIMKIPFSYVNFKSIDGYLNIVIHNFDEDTWYQWRQVS